MIFGTGLDRTRLLKSPLLSVVSCLALMMTISCGLVAAPSGTGTQGDPCLIKTADDLDWLRKETEKGRTAGMYYQQVGNIDMMFAEFAPIGSSSAPFLGNYDGDGNSILHLNVVTTSSDNAGLFGYMGLRSYVRNVRLITPYVKGKSYVGCVAGTLNRGNIYNCYVSGGSVYASGKYCGGIAGYSEAGTMVGNTSSVDVICASDYSGGLTGWNRGGTITTSSVSKTVTGRGFIGGITGYNSGLIYGGCVSLAAVNGVVLTGGFAGYNEGQILQDCRATGIVTATETSDYREGFVGGFVGGNAGTIAGNCSSDADVQGCNNAGGFVGTNTGYIDGCSARGQVRVTNTRNEDTYIGGFAGMNLQSISGCSAEVSLAGVANYAGGFAGSNEVNGVITGSSAKIVSPFKIVDMTDRVYYLGGLVGHNSGSLTYGCSVTGQQAEASGTGTYTIGGLIGANSGFAGWCNSSVAVRGDSYVGGMIGWNQESGQLGSLEVTGNVKGNYYVGGLIGWNDSPKTIEMCRASGAVTAGYCGGGLIGWNEGNLTNCYALGGAVVVTNAGGLVGSNHGTITTCYAAGRTTSTKDLHENGGLVGINDGHVVKSYWDTSTTGQRGGLTADQMKKQGSFVGWDFTRVWDIDEGESYPYFATGKIKVTIYPEAAVAAGAQWSIDGGGSWHDSGSEVDSMLIGSYYVMFKDVSGWVTPETSLVALAKNTVIETQGYYTALTGSLQVNFDAPVPAGARWSLDSGASWFEGGRTKSLAVGTYKVVFADVDGWYTPEPVTVTISENESRVLTAKYMKDTGRLSAVILPASAAADGGQWSVDGGTTWNASGATLEDLFVGEYTVKYKDLENWKTPASEKVMVTKDALTTCSGLYTPQTGTLQGVLSPSKAVDAGAAWSIDGGTTWNANDAFLTVAVGSYVVTFKPLVGWDTPESQIVTVEKNATKAVLGVYVEQKGRLCVQIEPEGAIADGGQWSIDGGLNWYDDGVELSLTVGDYAIMFKDLSRWITPAEITAHIKKNELTGKIGVYYPNSADLTVNLSDELPSLGRWSIDGGYTWYESGETKNLAVGDYSLSFKPVEDWVEPETTTITIELGKPKILTGVYTPEGSGVEEDPYRITEIGHLVWLKSMTLGGGSDGVYCKQMNDIDGFETLEWNAGAGFIPIGTEGVPFAGKYDGNKKKLSEFYVNCASENGAGIFGFVSGEIKWLGVDNAFVSGHNAVGALVGYLDVDGMIEKCYVDKYSVVFGNNAVGGMVGKNMGSIDNTYSHAAVEGNYYVGGLIGFNDYESGVANESYSMGKVTGFDSQAGGLVGYNDVVTSITSCFWDVDTSLQTESAGGFATSSPLMHQRNTFGTIEEDKFVAWDFVNTWAIVENNSYPYFQGMTDGKLTVNLLPKAVEKVGARWTIDGGVTWNLGRTISIPEGVYTVEFSAADGWSTPAPQTVTITKDGTTVANGIYNPGFVTVDLAPAEAVADGAKWSLDGGLNWNESGTSVPAAAGTQTITFADLAAWDAPAPVSFVLERDGNFTTSALYQVANGGLSVTLTPSDAVAAGAKWSVDGGLTWHESGSTVTLATGDYEIVFGEATGYETPAPQMVSVAKNAVASASGAYFAFDIALVSGDFSAGVSAPLKPGDAVDFSWTATATKAVSEPFWCEIFASKTGGFDQVRTGVTATSSYKAAGMGVAETIAPGTLKLNALSDGLYTLMPSVNRGSNSEALHEVNYTNNWQVVSGKRLAVHNPSLPNVDLFLVDVDVQPDLTVPNKVTVTGQICNGSTEDMVRPGCWVEVFFGTLTAEGTLMPQGTIGGGVNINTLGAGELQDFTLSGVVPGGIAAKALAVTADSTDIVPEIDETNNYVLRYDASILPSGKDNGIDLAVTDLSVDASQLAPASVAPGESLRCVVTVANRGTAAPSGKVYLEVFASRDGGASMVPGVTATWSELVEAPAPGTERVYNFAKPLNSIGDGMYTLVAVVNRTGLAANPGDMYPPDNRFAYATGRIFLSTPVDSGVRNIVWSEGPVFSQTGSQVTITGKIKNVGTVATRSFWTEAFIGTMQAKTGYFYKDSSKVFAGGVNCSGLAPNGEQSISITGVVPAGKMVGVLADSTDVVAETDETDNYDYSALLP